MKNVCRKSLLLVIAASMVTLAGSCANDSATRNKIVSVEAQIRQIDQQIAQLIASRKGTSNTVHLAGDRIVQRLLAEQQDNFQASQTNQVEVEIDRLRSEPEMLVIRLNVLYQSLRT